MASRRSEQLLAALASVHTWVSAVELATRFGVTTRSIRTYVANAKAEYAPHEVIVTGPHGYRLTPAGLNYARDARSRPSQIETPHPSGPEERQLHVIHQLLAAHAPLSIHTLAGQLFVSESTLESDLRRIRTLLADSEVSIGRIGPNLSLIGSERHKRRLLTRLYMRSHPEPVLNLHAIEQSFGSPPLGPIKTFLIQRLEAAQYAINEFGLGSALLALAIALHRVTHGHILPDLAAARAAHPASAGSRNPVTQEITLPFAADHPLAALAAQVLTPQLPDVPQQEIEHFATLLRTQVALRGEHHPTALSGLEDRLSATLSGILAEASTHYGVALNDDDLRARLCEHVEHALGRESQQFTAHNPMTKSLKAHFPLVYDIAVFVASGLNTAFDSRLDEHEIAFLALHIGAFLEAQSPRSGRLRCAFVCPDFYGMHQFLRNRLEQELNDVLEITSVVTRTDVDWAALDAELILSTIPAPDSRDDVLHIQPFLTEDDAELIRNRVRRVQRGKRRSALKSQLLRYLSPSCFVANISARNAEDCIRQLGAGMRDAGILDDSYIAAALAREALSSTAFGDLIAMPHAMELSAQRTAIAIGVNPAGIPWGEQRVQVVAFVAFSAGERADFQGLFDQLVSVFSSVEDTRAIVAAASSFDGFVDALTATMDA